MKKTPEAGKISYVRILEGQRVEMVNLPKTIYLLSKIPSKSQKHSPYT